MSSQEQFLKALTEQGEPRFTETWFPYTSGQVGPYYIESLAITRNGAAYHAAIDALCALIQQTADINSIDAISGGESRDWDFSNPVAYALGKPHVKIYKDKTTRGAEPTGRIIHVADLNNEGSSMRDLWHPTITAAGGTIVAAYFFVDRREEGIEVMQQLSIPSHSVVPMNEQAWQYLERIGYISATLCQSLQERINDRRAWAHRALRQHPEQLIEMLQDIKKAARAQKILNIGYPKIKDELIALMQQRGYNS